MMMSMTWRMEMVEDQLGILGGAKDACEEADYFAMVVPSSMIYSARYFDSLSTTCSSQDSYLNLASGHVTLRMLMTLGFWVLRRAA